MPRRATIADADVVAGIIARAFVTDPIWSVALARPDASTEHHIEHWRQYVVGAIPGGSVWITDGGEAASVWIPPGGHELSAAEEVVLDQWLDATLGRTGRDDYHELASRFVASHPVAPEHTYLSLLATDPAHRGRGLGMALLRANLAMLDAAGMPAYLESTNPANNGRYEPVGFARHGEFRAVRDDAV